MRVQESLITTRLRKISSWRRYVPSEALSLTDKQLREFARSYPLTLSDERSFLRSATFRAALLEAVEASK